MTSPWVKRFMASGHAARPRAEHTLGDSIPADRRQPKTLTQWREDMAQDPNTSYYISDEERELQDAYIHGLAVAAARAKG